MMKVKDWLIDLAENHRLEMVDGEICLVPIKEDEEDD
jgi:hypothetical protein